MEKMITYSIIQKSQLEGALRLDAEYYQPEYLKLNEIFKTHKISMVKELSLFVRKGIFDISPNKYKKAGIPLVRVQNIRSGVIDENNLVYLSEEDHEREIKTELRKFDIVFSKVGTVGEVAILNLNYKKWNFSQNVIGVKIDKNKITPAYLLFFLLSRIGQLQIQRAQMPQVQPKLELDDIRNLKVIRIENERLFTKYLDETLKLLTESKSLYSKAENLLLEELGLKDFKVEDDLFYIVNLSQIKSAHRADAEYFQPKYEKLINRIEEKARICTLKDIATVKRGSLIDPKFYDEIQGTSYIRGKDFSSGRLEKTDLVYIRQDFKPHRETRVKTGDIIFASIGSVGTTALVSEEFNNSFISNNTGKISINNEENLLPEYLVIVFHSIVGKLQFEKEASQTAQPKISDSQVRNFKIPILPKPTQQKIADLVQKSHEARAETKELLEKAKRKVEELIEKT